MTQAELQQLLEEKYRYYHSHFFIGPDPISVPHRYSKKEDIEISAFFAATLAWGQRPTIIKNALRLMEGMDHAPHDFILHHQQSDLQRFEGFVHRTFNYDDLLFFISALQALYRAGGGLEAAFACRPEEVNVKDAIARFRNQFFRVEHLSRSHKHLSDPYRGSACKRINMFLRWMVRRDKPAVDFGIWESIKPAQLSCPLDLHSGRVARHLVLLQRKQNDWKAVEELDQALRRFDPHDPVKYDFALFGMGVFEKAGS